MNVYLLGIASWKSLKIYKQRNGERNKKMKLEETAQTTYKCGVFKLKFLKDFIELGSL